MNWRVSKFFRWLAVIFAVLLVIYLAAVSVIGTQWFHNRLEQRIVNQLVVSTGARVELGELTIRPMIFQLTLNGLTLHGSEPTTQPPLFSAKLLVIRVNPLSVIRGKLLISRLQARGVSIHVTTGVNGSTNIPGPSSLNSPRAGRLLNVSIGHAVLEDASLFWNNRKIPLDLAARHIAVLLNRRSRRSYDGSFSTSPLSVKRRGMALPPVILSTRFEFAAGSLALSRLVWRSSAGSGRGQVNLSWNPELRGIAALDARGKLRSLEEALGWRLDLDGDYRVHCDAAYVHGGISVLGRVQTDRVSFRRAPFDPGPLDFTSAFSGNSSHISLTNIKLRMLGGLLTGAGNVRFRAGPPQFNLSARAQRVKLALALRAFPRAELLKKFPPFASILSGNMEANWSGAFQNLRSTFEIAATPPAGIAPGRQALVGSATGSIKASPSFVLTLDRARVATPDYTLTAQGTAGRTDSDLSIHYVTTNFQEAQRLVDDATGVSHPLPLALHSAASFVGAMTGSIDNPQFAGRISTGAFTYRGWAWSGFSGMATASAEGVAVSDGQLRSGPSAVSFNGSATLKSWKLTPQSRLRVSIHTGHFPVEGLESASGLHLPIPLSGAASGELEIAGSASNMAGSGRFRVVDGAVDGESFEVLSGGVLILGSTFNFQDVVLKKGAGELAGSARFSWPSKTFSVDFRGGNFRLASFKWLQAAARKSIRDSTATPVEGVMSVSLHGSGHVDHPQIQLAMMIEGLVVDGHPAGDFNANVVLSGKELSGEGKLQGAAGDLHFVAHAKTEKDWPFELDGDFSRLRLDRLFGGARVNAAATPMISAGSMVVSGPLRDPAKLIARIEADKLAILIPGYTLQNSQPVELLYSHGRIESNRFGMQGPSTKLKMHLLARLAPQTQISLEAHGDAQASLLRLFDPSIEAAGRFILDVHASGSPAQPALSGSVQVKNVSLRYRGIELPLSDLNGTIILQGNRAILESMKEQNGQTSLGLSGYATIGSNPAFHIQTKFQHLRLEYPEGFTTIASGNLELASSAAGSALTGEVSVNGMFVAQNFNVVDWIGQMGTAMETSGSTPAAGAKVKLNIHVTTSPVVRLDSRTLSYVAAIDVHVRGSAARPVMTGGIQIRQGQALVAGARYQINRGDITMTSRVETIPVVDIEATTRVERYNLTVEITGPADRARISYRSDPPLPTGQILSLLALGYVPQQALMSSTGAQHMGAIGAGSLLTQAISNQVSGRFQKIFGASRIRINPNLLGPSTAGGARVTVEERVSRDLTISYSTNTAAAQQRDIRLRWDVSNKISLIGERDINGVYGFEVRFQRSLK